MEKYIETASFWGTAKSVYVTEDKEKLAVTLPGLRYTNMAPLLYYPVNIALESGYDALAVKYGFQRGDKEFIPGRDSIGLLVKETKEVVIKCLEEKRYKEILFIGKSLGTLVQTRLSEEFAGYRQRHIFLTPLPECICVIKQTDCMTAVGTKDRVFKKEHIEQITGLKNVKLAVKEGADHSMEKGNFVDDLKVLAELCGHIYSFINGQA